MSDRLKKVQDIFEKCGELVLICVLEWTVGKDDYKKKLQENEKFSKNWNKWYKGSFYKGEQEILNESRDVNTFDICLVFKLIKFLSGIEDPESTEWTQGSSFAKTINDVKDLRNKFHHKGLTEDEKERDIIEWHQEFKQLFTEVLTQVGHFKRKPQEEVVKKIDECNKELECLQQIEVDNIQNQAYNTNHEHCLQHIQIDKHSIQVYNTKRHRKLKKVAVRNDDELLELLQNLKNPCFDCTNHNWMLRFDVKPNISHLEEALDLLSNCKHTEVELWLDYQYFSKITEESSDLFIQKLTSEASLCKLIVFRGRVTDFSLLPPRLRRLLVIVRPDEIHPLKDMLSQQRCLWSLVLNIECSPGQVISPPTLHTYCSSTNQLGIRLSSELNDAMVQWAVDILSKICPSTRDRHPRKWATSLGFWETHLTVTGIRELLKLLNIANFRAPENGRSANKEEFIQIRTYERIYANEKKMLYKLVKDYHLGDLKISCVSSPSASGGCEEVD